MSTNDEPSLCRRRNLRDIRRHRAIDHSNADTIQESSNQEHSNMHRARLDSSRDDTARRNDLNRHASAELVGQPVDDPAADGASAGVEAVARADDGAAIAAGCDEVEVGEEGGQPDHGADDGAVEAVGEAAERDEEGHGVVVDVGFGAGAGHCGCSAAADG